MRLLKLSFVSTLLILLLLVLLQSVAVHGVKSSLLVDQLLGCLIQLVDMIAEVLWGCQLEKVRIEGRHVGLDVIEEVSLHQVATVHTDGDLLKKL